MRPQDFDIVDIKLEGLQDPEEHQNVNGAEPFMRNRFGRMGTCPVLTAADLLRRHFPPPEYLVDGLVTAAGLGLFVGRPKVGKSRLGLQMGIAVSRGESFLGFRAKQGRVLMLLYEDTPRRLQQRLRAFGGDADNTNLELMLDPPALIGENLATFGQMIVSRRYTLVIVDTYQRAIVGTDPTDREQLATFFDGVQRDARRAGVMVLLVDHLNKSYEDHRIMDATMDSTVKWASCDLGLAMWRGKDRKIRFLATGRDLPGDVEYQLASNGIRWQIIDGLSDNERAVLGYVRSTECGAMADDVIKALKLAQSSVYHALNRLAEKGKLTKKKQGGAQLWTLPDFGDQLAQIDDDVVASLLNFD